MVPNIYTLSNEEIGNLGPSRAVDVLRKLIWAEANTLGISRAGIDVPSAINSDDGGIDAEIELSPKEGPLGILRKGYTAYQVKSGKFHPNLSGARSILFDGNPSKGYSLKPRVKSCLDKGGELIVVLFGWDGPDKEDS